MAVTNKDVGALVRSRGHIVSNATVGAWLSKQSVGKRDATEMANAYVKAHPKKGLAKGEKQGRRKKHCGVPSAKTRRKKGAAAFAKSGRTGWVAAGKAKKSAARKKASKAFAKSGRAGWVEEARAKKAAKKGGKSKKAKSAKKAPPRSNGKRMSLANRKKAAARIKRMPRDSKGRVKKKTRPNKGRKTTRRR